MGQGIRIVIEGTGGPLPTRSGMSTNRRGAADVIAARDGFVAPDNCVPALQVTKAAIPVATSAPSSFIFRYAAAETVLDRLKRDLDACE